LKLAPEQDAFGHMLREAHAGREAFEIIERDDGYIEVSAIGTRYLELPRPLDGATRKVLDAVRGRVLDVGCGAGRFALALQKRGHEVVGIDVSPGALEVARARGLRDARLLAASAIGPDLGCFDTVVMLGNNFGLARSARGARRLLSRLSRRLSPGGQILAQSLDVHRTEDPAHRAYQQRNLQRGRMAGQIRMRVRWRGYRTPYFDYLMVSAAELGELAASAGLRVDRVIELPGVSYVARLLPQPDRQ
jgi:SAM-dependent methyltransferase